MYKITDKNDKTLYEGNERTLKVTGLKSASLQTFNLYKDNIKKDSIEAWTKLSNHKQQPNIETVLAVTDNLKKWTVQSKIGETGLKISTDITNKNGSTHLWSDTGVPVFARQQLDSPIDPDKYKSIGVEIFVEDVTAIKSVTVYISPVNDLSVFASKRIDAYKLKNGWNKVYFSLLTMQSTTGFLPVNEELTTVQIRVDSKTGVERTSVFFDSIFVFNPANVAKVIFTFDDGWLNQYEVAYPMLSKRGLVGSIGVIGQRLESNAPNYMNLEQLKEVSAEGWEIFNHTYNHEKLGEKSKLEQLEDLNRCRDILVKHGFLDAASIVAYPYGSYNDETLEIMKENNYQSGRSLIEGVERSNLKNQFEATTVNLYNTISDETVSIYIQDAIDTGGVLIFLNHLISDNATEGTMYDKNKYEKLLDRIEEHIKNKELINTTMREML